MDFMKLQVNKIGNFETKLKMDKVLSQTLSQTQI